MLTCFLQRAEDCETISCQKCKKDEVDKEIPKELVPSKCGPLVVKQADHQWVLQEA